MSVSHAASKNLKDILFAQFLGRSDVKLDRRILTAARDERLGFLFTILLGSLQGVCIVLQAGLLSLIVNDVFLEGASLSQQRSRLYGLIALSILRFILSVSRQTNAQRSASKVKQALRGRLLEHLFLLGPAFITGERKGELANTLTEGLEALETYLQDYLPQLALSALIPGTILIFVLYNDFTSAIVLLVTAPLIPFFMVLIGDTADRMTKRQWLTLSRMSALFLETLRGLTTIKLFGQAHQHTRRLAALSERYRRVTLEVLRVAFLSALVLEWLATISTAVIAVEIGLRLLSGRLDFQPAFFILLLAPEFYLPLRRLGIHFHAGMSGVAAAERVFTVLAMPTSQKQVGYSPMPPLGHIELDKLTYTYPDRLQPAIRDVSLHLSKGKVTALVGQSGSGKSTVANCMLGFLAPQSGKIICNGKPLQATETHTLRDQIAWVPQAPTLFYGTVEQNLRVACPAATMAQLTQAAAAAEALEFIRALPEGFNTPIGGDGFRLSAGQIQRLSLARALLKDASVLLLDEVTAHLDTLTEAAIIDRLLALRQDYTILILTHRLALAPAADEIVLLANGEVMERGPHHQLKTNGGAYQKLLEAVMEFEV
jgi:ATP-binding cassette subfamily C protein CydD